MSVYVDDARIPARVGRVNARWSHLTADTDAELHAMADRLGFPRSWFQDHTDPLRRHYDVTETQRKRALLLGAVAETAREGARRRLALRRAARVPSGGAPQPEADERG